MTETAQEFETPRGPARIHLHRAREARAALVLGHGAGGGVDSPDLAVARDAALENDITVALVEQPYRVAGRRSPPRIEHLDEAWIAVVERLVSDQLAGLPLIAGGRSLGGRVACRTLGGTGAEAVLCLAFPLQPRTRTGKPPPPSRLPELEAVTVRALIVQGTADPFGMPPPAEGREVAQVPGNHSLRTDLDAVAEAVRDWLRRR